MNRPDNRSESRIESLLRTAADWEPDRAMPAGLIRAALQPAPKRQLAWIPALSACGAALAGVLAVAVMRPEVSVSLSPVPYSTPAPQLPETPDAPPQVFPPYQVEMPRPVPVAAVSRPRRLRRHRALDAPAPRKHVQAHARSHRRRYRETLAPREEGLQVASYQYVSEQKPLPKDAISLDESPKIVPVVVAEHDEETGGVRLHAGAASVPQGDGAISLE